MIAPEVVVITEVVIETAEGAEIAEAAIEAIEVIKDSEAMEETESFASKAWDYTKNGAEEIAQEVIMNKVITPAVEQVV